MTSCDETARPCVAFSVDTHNSKCLSRTALVATRSTSLPSVAMSGSVHEARTDGDDAWIVSSSLRCKASSCGVLSAGGTDNHLCCLHIQIAQLAASKWRSIVIHNPTLKVCRDIPKPSCSRLIRLRSAAIAFFLVSDSQDVSIFPSSVYTHYVCPHSGTQIAKNLGHFKITSGFYYICMATHKSLCFFLMHAWTSGRHKTILSVRSGFKRRTGMLRVPCKS